MSADRSAAAVEAELEAVEIFLSDAISKYLVEALVLAALYVASFPESECSEKYNRNQLARRDAEGAVDKLWRELKQLRRREQPPDLPEVTRHAAFKLIERGPVVSDTSVRLHERHPVSLTIYAGPGGRPYLQLESPSVSVSGLGDDDVAEMISALRKVKKEYRKRLAEFDRHVGGAGGPS